MPENKRELITLNIAEALQGTSIVSIERKKVLLQDFDIIPEAQLPHAAVVSGLPIPEKIHWYKGQQGKIDKIISVLETTITVFGRDNVTPDQTISTLLQEVWAAVFTDFRRGGHALSTEIKPEPIIGIFDPYYAFELVVTTTYVHDTTHI